MNLNAGLLMKIVAQVAIALVVAACGEVRAADPTAATPPTAAAPDAAPAKDAAPPAAGAKGPDGKPSPLHFEPTEKTRADFEVSFPTDI